MRFICQLAIPAELFANAAGKMVYVFMSDDDDGVDNTWEPNGGENAVVVQPAERLDLPAVETEKLESGPSLQRYVKRAPSRNRKAESIEMSTNLEIEEEPAFLSESQLFELSDEENERYWKAMRGNKIGGSPAFLQGDEFPDNSTKWQLLLQLDSTGVPFSVNFGDGGIGYVFVDGDVTKGRFLWQCC